MPRNHPVMRRVTRAELDSFVANYGKDLRQWSFTDGARTVLSWRDESLPAPGNVVAYAYSDDPEGGIVVDQGAV